MLEDAVKTHPPREPHERREATVARLGKALRTATDDLRNLLAATDVAAIFVDAGMAVRHYTPRAAQIFALIPGDVGRSLFDITHKLEGTLLIDDMTEACTSARPVEREVSSREGAWYQMRVQPYRTTDGRVDGAVLAFVDITGRRHAEDRARRGEERMRLVAESTRDFAILTMDASGRVTTWNWGAQRIFGWTEVEAIGQPGEMIFTEEDRQRGVPQEEMRKAREEGRAEDDRWHRRKDGSVLYCSGICMPLYEAGELRGYGKIARDLTGKRRQDLARDAALEKEAAGRAAAQAASELKDEFLAIMSHELKNPLNLIQLNAEVLARLPQARSSPALARAAAIIHKTVLSQAQIIDDLLDLSRINTGKLKIDRELIDLSAVVQRVASVVGSEASAKGVRLTVAAEPVMAPADPVRAEQIVWNLLSNALKFTPSGGSVDLRLHGGADEAVLEVADTGAGISPAFLPRLFGMFQQDDAEGRRPRGGMGIGLALVKHIVDLHGGSIEATSEGIDRGCRFTVRLPAKGTRQAVAAQAMQRRLPAGVCVLIVEDEVATLETLRDLLAMEGAAVLTARDGREGLAVLEREAVDIVITDISMPDMDGFQLMAAVRERGQTRQVPVVALTGISRVLDTGRLHGAGFAAWLGKPVALDGLIGTLNDVLRRQRRADGSNP